nr:GIY-YIG nuclease family protein [Algibacter onchidii]
MNGTNYQIKIERYYYVGYTENLKQRLSEHLNGKGALVT